ncbi:phosphotransferase enzyme family protein [Amycolatopsis sp. CA-230715]|uniref:phosphotransferase enzyme family protein n=1 Tax=Amycolatopsis sp. CA-230715 TaxID=2745196 RepID=UPI001C01473C|nr:aminoglycoside phosphotransferase family protein [Amycolatopsis sp. CA-230715]
MPGDDFTPDFAREELRAVCEDLGLSSDRAELVRMGSNALFRLADRPVMARVGRSVASSEKETAIASWLASYDFPSVRLAGDGRTHVGPAGMPVTFWEFIDSAEPSPTAAELGRVLCALHKLPPPFDLELPQFHPLAKLDRRIASIRSISESDRDFLLLRKEELECDYSHLEFILGEGVIHGDAHRDNLMRDRSSGEVKLIDFEDFSIGPREWDFCIEAIGYDALRWITKRDYEDYVRASGFDALSWSGYKVIRRIRELTMTTWIAQQAGQSQKVDREIAKRLSDLRNDDTPRDWGVF